MTRKRTLAASAAVSVLLGLGWVITGSAGAAAPAGPVTAADSAAAERALRAGSDGKVTVKRDRTGRVHFIGTEAGRPVERPSGISASATPTRAAGAHLDRYAALFGLRDADAELEAVGSARSGATDVVHFAQRQGGLPVIGGELVVSLDTDGNLVSVNGETAAAAPSRTAALPADAAARVAVAAIGKAGSASAGSLRAGTPALWIYDPALVGAPDPLGARPVWRLQVATTVGEPRRWTVLVDARTGSVALTFADLEHGKSRSVCDLGNVRRSSWKCPQAGVSVTRSEGQLPVGRPDVDAAYDLSGAVYDYYLDVLGRDSIDDNGMPLVTSVRYCEPLIANGQPPCPFGNAFWDGTQMTFGDGWVTDDIVAHELTHGVTRHTSDLLYYYQSGAINEAMSDVMGELFDQSSYSPGDDPADAWLVAEDLSGGAIRDMADPPALAQPDRMGSPLWTTHPFDQAFDAGGVHTNSGVANKAAYLMTDGDTFNGVTVVGIGGTKVANVWYATNQLLTSGADYADLYAVVQQACANLAGAGTAGVTTADCGEVKKALDAVEMSEPPANEAAIPQAYRCSSNYVNLDKFTDSFNRPTSGTIGPGWSESGSPYISDEFQPSAGAGNALVIPEPAETANNGSGINRYAYTSAWLTLSSTYTTYLHFDHAYSLDWIPKDAFGIGDPPSNQYYDGARVEVDVNGDGKSWLVPSSTAWINGPGKTLRSDHPILPSAKVFGGESRGWSSSRLALSSYKGKQVRVRYRLSTDGYAAISAGYGWWIDNVRLYQCSIPPTAPTSVSGRGYAGQAKLSWGAASANGGPAISKYVVYLYKESGGSYINRVELPSTARSYTFTTDSSGKTLDYYGTSYRLVVRARNVQGAYGPLVSKTLLGTDLTWGPSSATISEGGTVVISGVLRSEDDPSVVLGNRTVHLRYGPPGSWGTSTVGPSMKTASDGSYSFTVKPPESRNYRVYYSTGSTTYMGTRSTGTIKITVQ